MPFHRPPVLLALAALLLPPCLTAEESEKQEKESKFPEAEFVASDVFRSGSYIQPIWRRLNLEGHYFGSTITDVGYTGASWTFNVKGLGLAPGFGVAFGSNEFRTTPAATFRWDYEKRWFVTQGLIIQGFRHTPAGGEDHHHESSQELEAKTVRPTISDGSHVSARWKRLRVGGTWEHIQFREGNEWKGGGRIAFRLATHASAILYVLGPGRAEFRSGIMLHPAEKKD